jgi:hypothetical protein
MRIEDEIVFRFTLYVSRFTLFSFLEVVSEFSQGKNGSGSRSDGGTVIIGIKNMKNFKYKGRPPVRM